MAFPLIEHFLFLGSRMLYKDKSVSDTVAAAVHQASELINLLQEESLPSVESS